MNNPNVIHLLISGARHHISRRQKRRIVWKVLGMPVMRHSYLFAFSAHKLTPEALSRLRQAGLEIIVPTRE